MKHKAEIDKWVKEKVENGKIKDVIGLILTLMGRQLDSGVDDGDRAMPVFSSFPGNLEEEVTYDQLIFDDKPTHKKSKVLQYVKYLSPVQAFILALRYVVGYEQREVAENLGCSQAYIATEDKRLRDILRVNLLSKKKGEKNNNLKGRKK